MEICAGSRDLQGLANFHSTRVFRSFRRRLKIFERERATRCLHISLNLRGIHFVLPVKVAHDYFRDYRQRS